MALTTAGAGMLAGIPLALYVGRLLPPLLLLPGSFDGMALAMAVLLCLGATVVAALIPAYRAMSIDPIVSFRY
jgi:putative ABC transport system permease protein